MGKKNATVKIPQCLLIEPEIKIQNNAHGFVRSNINTVYV